MSEVQIEIEGHKLIINGELLIETVPDLEKRSKALLEKLSIQDKLVISFEHVNRVDTAGLAWLLNYASLLRKSNVQVSVEHPPEALLKLSRLSNAEAMIFGESTQD